MLTIFSVPKPFIGHIGIIQRNAIQSWVRLHPVCEIVLCGDELGIEEVATEFKTKWIPNLVRNEYGTPLLNSVFDQVQQTASHPLLCYVNADILLLGDFIAAVRRIQSRQFLMVGQRWDLDITQPWNFEQPNWEQHLRRQVTEFATLHPPSGSDYFVFPQDSQLAKLPPFAIGRPAWDNWFIYRARQLSIPVIDATGAATVVHQNHDYTHVPNQKSNVWEGPEADWNRQLAGGWDYIFTLLDATHIMTSKTLRVAVGYKYWRRRLHTLGIWMPITKPLLRIIHGVENRLVFLYCLVKNVISGCN